MQLFPNITYRQSAGGELKPVLHGTALRVQTVVVAAKHWKMEPEQIAREYDISVASVHEVLAFYAAHQYEIDAVIALEEMLEKGSIGGC
jgi:uncharacterized protein (DUF433 family)